MREIIGYILLKDLPDLKKGVLFKKIGRDESYRKRVVLTENQDYTYNYVNREDGVNAFYNPKTVENNKKWFKAVYK
jgi:hypothetical protein